MLLAFDLDKTIVRNDYELPAEIVDAVHKVRDAGHLVTVLTGRPKAASTAYLELLKVSDYFSTNHGALITGKAGAVLQQKRIGETYVAGLLKPYHDHPDIEFSCIVDDVLYVKNPDDERWAWAHTQNRGVEKFDPQVLRHADKIVFSSRGSTDAVHQHVSEAYPDFVMYPWEEGYLEVTGPNADKGTALQLIARELGVAQKDVIAFGDGPNDVTMLRWAGYGVAVGPHAHKDVIAAADEHIGSPEDLGVARWLEENILNANKFEPDRTKLDELAANEVVSH